MDAEPNIVPAPSPAFATALLFSRLTSDADFLAFWSELNRRLARKREAESVFADAAHLFNVGETAEGAAEEIEGQRWLLRCPL